MNFRAGLYSLVLGQCSEAMEDRLRSHEDFPGAIQNGIALLAIIKTLLHTFEERRKLSDALAEVKSKFYSFKQGRSMSLQRYHELFLAQVEVLDQVGVTIADEALVNRIADANGHFVPDDNDMAAVREQALAILFIRGTNAQNSSYLTHLRNSFLDGHDNYPTTVHAAYNILQRQEADQPPLQLANDGVAFVNMGTDSGRNLDHIACFSCGRKGHYANDCPNQSDNQEQDQDGVLAVTCGFAFSHLSGKSYYIPKTWVLLDNQSTINLFCNRELLLNIRRDHPVQCGVAHRQPSRGSSWIRQCMVSSGSNCQHFEP